MKPERTRNHCNLGVVTIPGITVSMRVWFPLTVLLVTQQTNRASRLELGRNLRHYNRLMKARASLSCGNCCSSALKAAEWTQRRSPRILTGCLRCSIS